MNRFLKYKKIFSILLIPCLFLMLSSCKSNKAVNDTETGLIQTAEPKYKYVDGEYRTISEYFNNDGYLYAMKISVQNGIINRVSFDMFDENLNRFSNMHDESELNKAEVFKSDIKTLTNELLQNQTSLKIYKDENYSYAFKVIANQTIENAKKGNTEVFVADLKEEYNRSYTNPNTDITSYLKVVYNYGTVNSLEFYQTNEFNAKLSNYTDNTAEDRPLSYKELMQYLNLLPKDELTLKKDNPTDYPFIEIDDYNILCDMINSSRYSFSGNYDSLFSSL